MRVISNISTGEMGHRISHLLCRERAKVTLVQGPGTHPLRHLPNKVINFQFFDELAKILKEELTKTSYDIVIHAAAVSDYKLRNIYKRKISSNLKEFKLDLVPTTKIIHAIKKVRPQTFLVGFKLETPTKKEYLLSRAATLFKKAKCDLVVANVLIDGHYKAYLIDKDKKILGTETSREKLAQTLIKTIKKKL